VGDLRARGEVLVVAIGSSCCGDTLEGDLEKGWYWKKKRQPLRTALKFYI